MDKLVYLTYPVMAVVLTIGATWYGKDKWNEEFFSLKQTKYIQGYIALSIMIHHIAQETCGSWHTYPLIPGLEMYVNVGYLFVAVFMMCSGYGLYRSYISKADYFAGFFKKRVLPIIFEFYVTGIIYLIARMIMKEHMKGEQIFYYITGYVQANEYAWYALVIPYFYLIFYLSFKFIKKDSGKIWGVVAGTFIYTLIGTMINHNNYLMRGEWWYNSVHLFWIGMIFARYENVIVTGIKAHYVRNFVINFIMLLVIYRISRMLCDWGFYYGENNRQLTFTIVVLRRWAVLFTEMLASLCFVIFVMMLNMKLKLGNRLLALMGTITLEFYLMHGLFLELFSYKFFDTVPSIVRITNVPLLIIVVFVLTIPSALLLKKISGIVTKRN